MKMFEDTKIPILAKALNAYALRHKAISSNIANITTVGYHTQSVSFEDHLNSVATGQEIVAATTNRNHIPVGSSSLQGASPEIVEAGSDGDSEVDPTASGLNDVDIDREMTELAKNQLRFKFASRLLGDSFRALQKSIRGQV